MPEEIKKRGIFRIGIRIKVMLTICLVTMIMMTVSVALKYSVGVTILRDTIGNEHREVARLLVAAVGRIVDQEVEDVNLYSANRFRKGAVQKNNSEYTDMTLPEIQKQLIGMDKKWAGSFRESPLVKQYVDSDIAVGLRNILKEAPEIIEIFMTDRFGGLVAASGRTSDFYQADEKWWQKAFADGLGDVYIGDISLDESSETMGMTIAVPIRDDAGSVIGVTKAVLKTERFFGHLADLRIGKTGHAVLVDGNGYIVFHDGEKVEPGKEKFLNDAYLKKIHASPGGWIIARSVYFYAHARKVFVTFAKIENATLLKNGIHWNVYVEQDAREVFAPITTFFLWTTMVTAFLMIMVLPLGYFFGSLLVRPIEQLRRAVERIAAGDVNETVQIRTGDEIERLAYAFNAMIVSIKSKQKALEDMSSGLEDKVKERTQELTKSQKATLNILEDLKKAKEKIDRYSEDLEKALRIKSDFTSMVSHELRTPLTAIKESIAIVLDGSSGPVNSEQKDFLETAKRNLDRLARLINDVLDLQKLEAGKIVFRMEQGDINSVVKEVVQIMEPVTREKQLRLAVETERNLPEVRFDRDKIIQVLVNLLNNAVKFTEEGGITIRTAGANNFIQVSVEDTGTGIKKSDIPKLFQQFVQLERGEGRKTGGTGLGLAISKEIVQKHGGKIWAESEEGKGTTFHFTLPIKERRG
ncbi:MAG: ATP-binding protein [Candidatus Omnitrophota bacterium]